MPKMALFPIFLKLEKRRVLVVGGGRAAEMKIRGLLRAGAEVTVIAPRSTSQIDHWAHEEKLNLRARRFLARDLDGAALAISATNSAAINGQVQRAARRRGIFCNSVDDPERCDFYCGATLRRGDLQIAISTAGASPALAQRLRRELEEIFTSDYAQWLTHLRRSREKLFAGGTNSAERRRMLHRLASRRAFLQFRRSYAALKLSSSRKELT